MTYFCLVGLRIQDVELQNLYFLQVGELLISNGKSLKDSNSLP